MTAQYAVWKKVADFPQFRRNLPHPAKLDAERWTVAWTTKTILRNFYAPWESNIARKSPTVDEQNPANHLECKKILHLIGNLPQWTGGNFVYQQSGLISTAPRSQFHGIPSRFRKLFNGRHWMHGVRQKNGWKKSRLASVARNRVNQVWAQGHKETAWNQPHQQFVRDRGTLAWYSTAQERS